MRIKVTIHATNFNKDHLILMIENNDSKAQIVLEDTTIIDFSNGVSGHSGHLDLEDLQAMINIVNGFKDNCVDKN